MKQITIVGVGLSADTLTVEGRAAIEQASVLLGAERLLAPFAPLGKASFAIYAPDAVARIVREQNAECFCVLVSGDVGFYSAAAGLCEALAEMDVRCIPGISTVSAFFAKLKLPWQNAAFVSAHGREMNIADAIRRNRLTFCLTGNNCHAIGAVMCKAGFRYIKTHIGENLGAERERVYEAFAEHLTHGAFPPLTVLLFVNEAYDDRTPRGLPDDSFSRLDGIPMTKSEIRALVMSKLNLRPDDICWDIGAGTGSVTVEMALNAYRGHVFAIERREDAISLIERNCAAFHVGNITAIHGEAPGALMEPSTPDAVFIGGSGGEISEIIIRALEKNPDVKIVVTAVTIETVSAALTAFQDAGLEPEITQISVARGRRAGASHLMEAQNPVTILSVDGRPAVGGRP